MMNVTRRAMVTLSSVVLFADHDERLIYFQASQYKSLFLFNRAGSQQPQQSTYAKVSFGHHRERERAPVVDVNECLGASFLISKLLNS